MVRGYYPGPLKGEAANEVISKGGCHLKFCQERWNRTIHLFMGAHAEPQDGLGVFVEHEIEYYFRLIRLTQVTTTYRICGYGRLPHEFNGI